MKDFQSVPGSPESGDDTLVVAGTPCADQSMETAGAVVSDSGSPGQSDGSFRAKVDQVMAQVRSRTQACPPGGEVYAAVEEGLKTAGLEPTMQAIRGVYFRLLRKCHSRRPNGLGWRM